MSNIEKIKTEIAQHEQALQKLKAQDSKLSSHLKQVKQTMQRKNKASNNKQVILSQADDQKIEKQLQKQLQNAKNKLKQYQNELKAETKKMSAKSSNTLEDLFSLQQAIKQKDLEIKQLNQQMKQLNAHKRKQQKVLETKEKQEDGNKVTKLAQQIRGLKQLLMTMQTNYAKKREGFTKKQKQIQQLEEKYRAICQKNGEKPITFQQFKEKRKQKKKDEELNKDKKQPLKKQYMSIKDIINNKDNYQTLEPTEQNLRELRSKRQIAENALKNARKKHEKEIQQLNKKLSFLYEQNSILQNRLKEKEKEKQLAEARFAETKKNTIRKLTPLK